MCSIHTVECYSILKRKEILTYATTWMNIKNILHEISQTNIIYSMIPLIYEVRGDRK